MKKSIKNLTAVLAAASLTLGLCACSSKASSEEASYIITTDAVYTTYKPDSEDPAKTVVSEKDYITFTELGDVLNEGNYFIDCDGTSVINSKSETKYDNEGKIISFTELIAPDTVPYKTLYHYKNGLLSDAITYWEEACVHVQSKIEYEYDSDGNCTKKTDYESSNEESEIELRCVDKWSYENGKLSEWQQYVYDSDGETLNAKVKYSYNAAGKLSAEINYDPDDETSVIEKKEYEYDASGKKTKESSYYDELDSETVYTYDARNLLIEKRYDDKSGYAYPDVTKYTYDDYGRFIEEYSYYIDTDNGDEEVFKEKTTAEYNGRLNSVGIEKINGFWINKN